MVDFGITGQLQAVQNSINNPSVSLSSNLRYTNSDVVIQFDTSTTVEQFDLLQIEFPEGVTVSYDFQCTSNSGFTGTLSCVKMSELVIMVQNGFGGSAETSPGTFSLTITGIYGYLEQEKTASVKISVS